MEVEIYFTFKSLLSLITCLFVISSNKFICTHFRLLVCWHLFRIRWYIGLWLRIFLGFLSEFYYCRWMCFIGINVHRSCFASQ